MVIGKRKIGFWREEGRGVEGRCPENSRKERMHPHSPKASWEGKGRGGCALTCKSPANLGSILVDCATTASMTTSGKAVERATPERRKAAPRGVTAGSSARVHQHSMPREARRAR